MGSTPNKFQWRHIQKVLFLKGKSNTSIFLKWLKCKNETETFRSGTFCISQVSHKTQRQNPLGTDPGIWFVRSKKFRLTRLPPIFCVGTSTNP